jgi:hypothetical protein
MVSDPLVWSQRERLGDSSWPHRPSCDQVKAKDQVNGAPGLGAVAPLLCTGLPRNAD